MSELFVIILLGIVEGLTEFIPVSSTGHLILVGDALGFKGERAGAFDVFIQLGAILAVVVLYRKRFLSLLDFSAPERSGFRGQTGLLKLAAAVAPALVVGVIAHSYIKEHLFNSITVAAALIAGGLVLIWIEKRNVLPRVAVIEEIPLRTCFLIGLFQCISLWPGISRSGSTIVGGMLLGLNRVAAAEFSFLVAVPVMFAATGYDLLKSLEFLSVADLFPFALGFVVAFISALLAISFFMQLLKRCTLAPFGIYRIILGLFVLGMK